MQNSNDSLNSSSTNSYSDNNDVAEWEQYVADNGSLFYAEYLTNTKKCTSYNPIIEQKNKEFRKNASHRQGKKTNRCKTQQEDVKRHNKQNTNNKFINESSKEYTFSNIISNAKYCKQIELIITSTDRYRFGRRSTAVESILGIQVIPFKDKPECLMVVGFLQKIPILQNYKDSEDISKLIKCGDWFKSLNDIDIRASNIDDLLLQFAEPTKVYLKFQSFEFDDELISVDDECYSYPNDGRQLKIIENFGSFVNCFAQILQIKNSNDLNNIIILNKFIPFSLLILPSECYQHDRYKDSLYYYPECVETNFLYNSRGSFLTLNTVLIAELNTAPLTSKIKIQNEKYFVNYRTLNGFLVLFAFPTKQQTMEECNLLSDEFINYMFFAFPSLNLDNLSMKNKTSNELRKFLSQFCEIQTMRLKIWYSKKSSQFEDLLCESRCLYIPKEAQLRIFDALSEMEAMDYRNWNDEPLTTHREFFMHGSVLYYDRNMLVSELSVTERTQIDCFLRCRGIFDFIDTLPVRKFCVWEEIILPSMSGRYFLTVCAQNHLILVVILKIFNTPDIAARSTIPPSLFYIEEIEETLNHLIECGIESLAFFWSMSNKRPEVYDKLDLPCKTYTDKDTRKMEYSTKQKVTIMRGNNTIDKLLMAYEQDNQVCSSLIGSSTHSQTQSEDDSSRKTLPINNKCVDSDSGSDWESFDYHPLHFGLKSEKKSCMIESLWKEINNILPIKISTGWQNSIFSYVYVDKFNYYVFSPLRSFPENNIFLNQMRKACHIIHKTLDNAKSQRRFLNDSPKSASVYNADSSMFVKEYSITIRVVNGMINYGNCSNTLKGEKVIVLGRFFNTPTKEVYICHAPDASQNIIEMAFRLSFFSFG